MGDISSLATTEAGRLVQTLSKELELEECWPRRPLPHRRYPLPEEALRLMQDPTLDLPPFNLLSVDDWLSVLEHVNAHMKNSEPVYNDKEFFDEIGMSLPLVKCIAPHLLAPTLAKAIDGVPPTEALEDMLFRYLEENNAISWPRWTPYPAGFGGTTLPREEKELYGRALRLWEELLPNSDYAP